MIVTMTALTTASMTDKTSGNILQAPPANFIRVEFDLSKKAQIVSALRRPLSGLTELPPRKLLEEKLHSAIQSAKERIDARPNNNAAKEGL